VTLAAPLIFGIPALLCLVLSVGWWKVGAVVPLALLAGALTGCPFLVSRAGAAARAPLATGAGELAGSRVR
jgi:predicted membrane-bound mannosyltransferase